MSRMYPVSDLDRLAGQLFAVGREPRSMPMDLYRSGEHYVVHCDLPGIDPGSVDIEVDGAVLTIRAERSPRTAEDFDWLIHERPVGTYQRQLKVGAGVDVENVTATLEHGVLTLTLPIAERAKPRRIAVEAASPTTIDSQKAEPELQPAEKATA